MTALRFGARLVLDRVGLRFALLTAVLGTTAVALAATLERRGSPVRAVDHTLVGAVFGIALPLVAYASLVRLLGGAPLGDAATLVARFGWSRRVVTVGALVALAAWGAVMGAWLAVVGVVVARGPGNPALLGDALTSARVGLVGGVAYVTFLCVGGTFRWARGAAAVLLAADWILGSSSLALGAAWPRSHLRNLLGAPPVLDMAQWQASVALLTITAVSVLVVAARTRP